MRLALEEAACALRTTVTATPEKAQWAGHRVESRTGNTAEDRLCCCTVADTITMRGNRWSRSGEDCHAAPVSTVARPPSRSPPIRPGGRVPGVEPAPTRPTGADPTGGPGREPAVPTSWRGRRSS